MGGRLLDKQAQAPPAGLPVQHRSKQKQIGPLARNARLSGTSGRSTCPPHLPGVAEPQKQGSARSPMVLSGTPEGHHLHGKAQEMLIHLFRSVTYTSDWAASDMCPRVCAAIHEGVCSVRV